MNPNQNQPGGSLNRVISTMTTHVSESYGVLEEKGAKMPKDKNMANLPSCIDSLPKMGSWKVPEWTEEDRSDYGAFITISGEKVQMNRDLAGALLNSSSYFTETSLLHSPYYAYDVSDIVIGPSYNIGAYNNNLVLSNLPSLRTIEGWENIPQSTYAGGALGNLPIFSSNVVYPNYTQRNCMYNLYSFNAFVTFPETISVIGPSFLRYALMFNQDLTIPSNITKIGESFLEDCPNMCSTIYVGTSTLPGLSNVTAPLSTSNPNSPCYAQGIILTGPGAKAWKETLPDLDGVKVNSKFRYRKLILDPAWA